ncbi:MAG: DUF4936 family protein [Aquabacterium sp.]|jgi:hypothetical protein|nr:MAG: DUF4936 family protein [Aquabacterium sp.]
MPSPDAAVNSGAEAFIYYRVPAARTQQAREAACRMHEALRAADHQLVIRLLRRGDTAASADETWMETYSRPGGVDAALLARIESLAEAWADCRSGARHTEIFEACAW